MSPPPAFGTYRVLHQIGSGVLGPVFRAYDSQQDRLVAIKTIKLDLVPEDAARLADRLRAMVVGPAPHAAVVRAMDAGLERSTPFLALEYAAGESLDVAIRQLGPAPIARALPILRVIADAIDAMWAAGVGHGSLHPRDVFIDSGPEDLRISGFGVGQALEAVGARVPVRRPYSAPERADGPGWDVRADVFSLGVVAHEMLSGQRPLGADGDEDGVAADLSPELRAAVRRVLAVALADSPADRYESALALVNALAAAAGEPAVAPIATAPEPTHGPGPTPDPAPQPAVFEEAPRAGDQTPPIEPIKPIAVETALPDSPQLASPGPAPVEAAPAPVVVEAQAPAPALRLPVTERSRRPPAFLVDRPVTPIASPPAAETTPFPWAALVAVLAAGLVAGAVGGYQWGWYRGSLLSQPSMVVTTVPVGPIAASPTPELTPAPPAASPAPTRPAATAAPAAAAAPLGRLVIQSVPSGALVMLDGQRVGETPLRLSASMGRHEIQIARPGYVPRIERVELTRGSAARTVSVQLRRGAGSVVPSTGAVDVDSRPQKAQVTVDGVVAGQTPIRVPELTAGSHRVQIALAGHKTVTSMVNIVGGEVTRLAVTLEQGGVAMIEFPRSVR